MKSGSATFGARGCPFGSHRAAGGLPQPADRVDTSLPIRENELLIRVEALNLDSSSMRQIADSCGADDDRMRARILEIVAARGKMHNPATGSGGVLVGRVAEIGPAFPADGLAIGDRICTLVSLSLTPLVLQRIGRIKVGTAQVEAQGHAILFETGLWAKLPQDIPEPVALALFDVAGAPGTVVKAVAPGNIVFVLGAGKAGLLAAYAARRKLGRSGLLIAADASEAVAEEVRQLAVADRVLRLDLRDPIAAYEAVGEATEGRLADLTVNTTNVPGTEGATILATRKGGRAFFFSMATSFTAAALSAEGVGRDIEMLIGNGFTSGWTEAALDLYRANPDLATLLRSRIGA